MYYGENGICVGPQMLLIGSQEERIKQYNSITENKEERLILEMKKILRQFSSKLLILKKDSYIVRMGRTELIVISSLQQQVMRRRRLPRLSLDSFTLSYEHKPDLSSLQYCTHLQGMSLIYYIYMVVGMYHGGRKWHLFTIISRKSAFGGIQVSENTTSFNLHFS